MRAYLLQTYERVRASYWFLPSLMALGAIVLAFLLIELDLRLPADIYGDSPFLFATQPDGARAVLGAIGGSMIGVAGTVFSVTMAAVVFASGSYGPRLLTNFMNDRGNQVTLGVFVATFVYSMLVLRSVRDAGSNVQFFVPNTAIFGAIVLALGSIAILIYFIHHVPSNIHISNVIANIAKTLLGEIDNRFPAKVGLAPDEDIRQHVVWQVPACFRAGHPRAEGPLPYAEVTAERSGYIQIMHYGSLMRAARDHDLIVRLVCRPGGFAHTGQALFEAWPAERLTDDARDALLTTLVLGSQRTPAQDLLFLFDELVEIAARALSPGVNDPLTAVTCIDWLAAAFAEMARRPGLDPLRVDGDGKLRVIAEPIGFAGYLEYGFGRLRQYAAKDRIAGTHIIAALASVVSVCRTEDQVEALRLEKAALMTLAGEELSGPSIEAVEAAGRRFDDEAGHWRASTG
ncbi:DUF2254 domain-containing protein [Consotaella aegiceratis]|uniref:DUF2254 domain-containing protein n=1 Tax=Consotaella aegiceratis TaxID=3097961 RepID=UPI002F416E6E